MKYLRDFISRDFLLEQLPIVLIGAGFVYFLLIALRKRKNKKQD